MERLLPKVLADVQRVATDAALIATLSELAGSRIQYPAAGFPRPTDKTSGELLRWLGQGTCCWAYQRCRVA